MYGLTTLEKIFSTKIIMNKVLFLILMTIHIILQYWNHQLMIMELKWILRSHSIIKSIIQKTKVNGTNNTYLSIACDILLVFGIIKPWSINSIFDSSTKSWTLGSFAAVKIRANNFLLYWKFILRPGYLNILKMIIFFINND